jgi:hypothetical protein
VATLDDAAAIALDLPQVTEGERHRGNRTWVVDGKVFVWERPFSKADIRRFGDATPPAGPILAVRVEDKRQPPPRLHDLPSLQKLCGARFGWSDRQRSHAGLSAGMRGRWLPRRYFRSYKRRFDAASLRAGVGTALRSAGGRCGRRYS